MSRSSVESSEKAHAADPHQSSSFEQNMLLAAKGGGITFGGKLFTYGSRLIIAFLLARYLGAGEYGLYKLALTVATLAGGLAVLGLEDAMLRYVPLYAARRDEAGLWGGLQLSLGLTTLLGVIIGLVLYVLATPLAERLFDAPDLAPLLRLVGVIVPFLTLSDVLAAATRGFKQMQYATLAQDVLQPLVKVALILVLALVGLNAGFAVAIYGVAVAGATVLLLYFLNHLFSLRRSLRAARRDTRTIMGFALPVYLSGLISMSEGNLQTLLLGAMSTLTSVGIFALSRQLTLLGSMFQSAVTTASKPILSELYERRAWGQMGLMYQTTGKWMFAVNLPLFLMLVLFPASILSVFGGSFVAGSTVLVILATAIIVDVSTGMCGAVIDMTGRTRLKLVNTTVRLVLSLGLNFLLIPLWGIRGAAIATLVTAGTVNLLRLSEVYVLYRLIPYNASFLKPLLAGALATAGTLAMRNWLGDATGLLTLIPLVSVLFVIYASTLLLLGFSEEDRIVLAHVRRRMGKMATRRKKA